MEKHKFKILTVPLKIQYTHTGLIILSECMQKAAPLLSELDGKSTKKRIKF